MLSKDVCLQNVITFSFLFIIFTTFTWRATFVCFPDKECGLLPAQGITRYNLNLAKYSKKVGGR